MYMYFFIKTKPRDNLGTLSCLKAMFIDQITDM